MQSISCERLGWMKHKLESRLLGKISTTSDVQMTPPLWQKRRASKEPLDEGQRGEWKSWLKTKHSKTKIMASDAITSWQIEGGKVETVTDFTFLGSQITADNDCCHEIERHAPWKKSYDKRRQHIKNRRHHFANKSWYNQSYSFSNSHVWMWELDCK